VNLDLAILTGFFLLDFTKILTNQQYFDSDYIYVLNYFNNNNNIIIIIIIIIIIYLPTYL